jgi:uncharacterized RDD family membrane protein YckC
MNRENPQLILLRVLAFVIDALSMLFILIVPTTLLSYGIVFAFDSTASVARIWQATTVLFAIGILARDAISGRSPGKRLLGLVIKTPRGKGCGPIRSVVRNLFLLIPGLNLIEVILLLFTRNGTRLGDLVARSRVEQE